MTKNSYICNFISKNDNWEELLHNKPYFINIKKEGNLAIFNYNLLASEIIESENEDEVKRCVCDFNLPEVQEARGIVINYVNKEVACWPFRKFGNYGESYADSIDWESACVQEKVDGSIMKLWFNKEKLIWYISSNKTIDASEASTSSGYSLHNLFIKAAENQSLNYDILNKDSTYIFELVSPYNRVVVKYDEVEIYHLGTRNNITGEEYDVNIGIKKPKKYSLHSLEDCLKAAEILNAGKDNYDIEDEGFVVVDAKWNRVKIKSPSYVLVHHALNGGILSKRKIISLILAGEQSEYLSYYPGYKELFDEYESKIKFLEKEILEQTVYFEKIWNKYKPNMKDFALAISGEKRVDIGFKVARAGKSAEEIFHELDINQILKQIE